MIGLTLIVLSGVGYKVICRTKMRDPRTADLQTGRRPLSEEEILDLDKYHSQPRWRKFKSFVQLW